MSPVIRVMSPYSLLVYYHHGLKRIYCPFKVEVVVPHDNRVIGEEVIVRKVIDCTSEICFMVEGESWPYFYFRIL